MSALTITPIYQLVKPDKVLEPYIYFYTYFESFIPEDECIYMMPSADIKLSFNFGDCASLKDIRLKNQQPAKMVLHTIFGLQQNRNYNLILKKNTLNNSLIVFFKPQGFSEIFSISSNHLIDNHFSIDELLGKELEQLVERLTSTSHLSERGTFLDNYFKKKLEKKYTKRNQIFFASQFILENTGAINLKKLAYDCNLSPRQFERKFKELVGISAMKLQSINRFEKSLKLKERYPEKKWTDIAYEVGYSDQTHLIREFKNFSSLTPNSTYWKSGIDGKHWHFLRELVNVDITGKAYPRFNA